MVSNFEDFPKGLLLSGLFIVCLLSFMTGIGLNYSQDISTPYVDSSRIQDQIEDTSSTAEAWGEAFKSDNLFVSTGAIVLFSIWGVMKLIWGSITTFITIYLDIFTALFGVPPIVTGTITALVIISLIFLAWRTIKQG